MFPSVLLGLQVEAMCRSRQMPTHSRWDALLYERETQSSGSSPCHRKHNQVCVVQKGDLTSCLKLAHCLSEHCPEHRSGCKVMLPCVLGMLIKMHRGIGCLQKSVSPIISSYYSILLANRPLTTETVGKRKLLDRLRCLPAYLATSLRSVAWEESHSLRDFYMISDSEK